MSRNKIISALIIIVAISGLIFAIRKHSATDNREIFTDSEPPIHSQENIASISAADAGSEQNSATANSENSGNSSKDSTAYTKVLQQYKDRILQFDKDCQARPNQVTYKNTTTILLDNRSDKSARININGHIYNLAAYSYITNQLSSKTLPTNIFIDCNSSQNVATILLQK